MVKWVLLKKYCELTGDTRNGFNHKVQTGNYVMGKHFKKVENRIWVNLEQTQKWIENCRVA